MPYMTNGQVTHRISDDPSQINAMLQCDFTIVNQKTPAPNPVTLSRPKPKMPAKKPKMPADVPSRGASRRVWADYAESLGIEVGKLTRGDLQQAVAALQN